MNHLCTFSGIGGWGIAAEWMGWHHLGFVEKEPFCQKVLAKNFPGVPIHDDIFTFSAKPFRGRVDVLTGSTPCQPFSAAGKRQGSNDERHLFPEFLRVVAECQPRWIVIENVYGLLNIESGQVFQEYHTSLESEGYIVQTICIPASAINAPHRRDRLWIVAHSVNSADRANRGQIRETESVPRIGWAALGARMPSGTACDVANAASDGFSLGHTPTIGKVGCGEQGRMLESEGKDSVTANARREYGTRDSERLDTNPSERTTGDVHSQRCDSESKDADGDDRHTESTGQSCSVDRQRQGEYGRTSPRSSWGDENWIEAATRLCSLHDGVPGRLLRLLENYDIDNEQMGGTKSISEGDFSDWEILRRLWEYGKTATPSSYLYFIGLCDSLPKMPSQEGSGRWMATEETAKTMRDLWERFYALSLEKAHNVRGELLECIGQIERNETLVWTFNDQQVPELRGRVSAFKGETSNLRKIVRKSLSLAETATVELMSPSQVRVNSLKALGNAIVPHIAYEIFRVIEQVDI